MRTRRTLRHLRRINLVAKVCHAALGPGHHPAIRYAAGGLIMCLGIGIVKLGGEIHIVYAHFASEVVGAGIHGIGLVPFLERMLEWVHNETETALAWPTISEGDGSDTD